MPQVGCPRCGRQIPLHDSELSLLIECADCSARFYPMMPLDEPDVPVPVAAAVPQSGHVAHISRRDPLPDEAWSANPASSQRRRRKKKKERNWVPLVVGVTMGAMVLLASG